MNKSRRRWSWKGCAALIGVAGLGSTQCVYWDTWDNVFLRRSGWLMADGGYSIPLPPVGAPKGSPPGGANGGRHYFFFGDGAVWNPGFTQSTSHQYTTQELLNWSNAFLLFGNTAAIVSYTSDAWVPGTVEFYARERNGNCEGSFSNCPVVNLNNSPTVSKVIDAAGFQPRRLASDTYQWPRAAVYVENPGFNLPPGYQPPAPVNVNEPFVAMGFGEVGGSENWGFNFATNITQALPNWTYAAGAKYPPVVGTGTTEGNWGGTKSVDWAAALIHVPGQDRVYIYGRRLGFFGQVDVVLAAALPSADIADPNRWFYFYKAGTQGCPATAPCWGFAPSSAQAVDNLHLVAEKAWNDFSVDYICHNEAAGAGGGAVDACAFVMVHGTFPDNVEPGGPTPALDSNCKPVTGLVQNPDFPNLSTVNARWGMVRTTSDGTQFPAARHGSEGTTRSTYLADELINPGWDREILCDSPRAKRRMVRQLRGQAGMREPGSIYLSWYVGVWQPEPNEYEHLWVNGATTVESSRKSNMRFGKFPLSYVRPWCTATGTCP
jgi:hypothetical protein